MPVTWKKNKDKVSYHSPEAMARGQWIGKDEKWMGCDGNCGFGNKEMEIRKNRSGAEDVVCS